MIRIYKDNDIKVVTRGAYDTFYKPLGYNIVIEQTKTITKQNIVSNKNKTVTNNKLKKDSFVKKNKKEG